MTETKTPKSELLRDWIGKQLDSEVDLSSPFKRNENFAEFLKNNPDWENQKSDRPLYYNLWKKECKKKGIDLRSLGIKDTKIFSNSKSQSINATITPKPKQIDGQAPTHQETTQQNKLVNPNIPNQIIPQQPLKQYSKEEVKELVKGSWYGLKIKWSDIEDLDDEELDILSGTLKPICDRHMQGDITFYLAPMVILFGIAGGKIRKARQAKKEREAKEKLKENQDEPAKETSD